MQKYKVLKSFINPWGTAVTPGTDSDAFVLFIDVEAADPKIGPAIATLIAEGAIELVPEAPAPAIIKYEVVKGPIAIPGADTYQTGNVMEFPEGDPLAASLLETGAIVVFGTIVPVKDVGNITAPVKPGTINDSEPRKRYRGQIITAESDRTVGEQTFKHIACADGTEYDLTNKEYKGEVHVSYPPHN